MMANQEITDISKDDLAFIKPLVDKWKDKAGNLIMVLHELQNHYGYIPRGASLELSAGLGVPLARIYEVITFYHYFRVKPPARHQIAVCMGTACYLKGATEIVEELKTILGIDEDQSTPDGNFQLSTVRCLGCCGLAPVMMIDQKVYGKVKRNQLLDILSEYATVKETQSAVGGR